MPRHLAQFTKRALLEYIAGTVNRLEGHMSALDDVVTAVSAIADEVETTVTDLRTQLAAAQADDADVTAQVDKLSGIASRLRGAVEPTPAEPGTDVPPADPGADTPPAVA